MHNSSHNSFYTSFNYYTDYSQICPSEQTYIYPFMFYSHLSLLSSFTESSLLVACRAILPAARFITVSDVKPGNGSNLEDFSISMGHIEGTVKRSKYFKEPTLANHRTPARQQKQFFFSPPKFCFSP